MYLENTNRKKGNNFLKILPLDWELTVVDSIWNPLAALLVDSH